MDAASEDTSTPPLRWRYYVHLGLAITVGLLTTYLGVCTGALLIYTQYDPPITGIQAQRHLEAVVDGTSYTPRVSPVPLSNISDHLEHAVVAAEDARFFTHHGIDWIAIQEAMEDNLERGTLWRGGSTLTQQLVKNLFMTTHSTLLRKGLEVPLTYLADLILTKDRILELYLNVVEWGPGVYGAEAAARHHYGTSAAQLSRYRAAALAACLPNPRVRSPQRMTRYTYTILARMQQHGW